MPRASLRNGSRNGAGRTAARGKRERQESEDQRTHCSPQNLRETTLTLGQRATSLLLDRRAVPSSTVRTGHACADPGFQSFHELLVRERRRRAVGARRPGPEDERIRLHVLDDLLAAVAAAIPCRVFHLLADLLLRPAFPEHGQRCKMPGCYAGHE